LDTFGHFATSTVVVRLLDDSNPYDLCHVIRMVLRRNQWGSGRV